MAVTDTVTECQGDLVVCPSVAMLLLRTMMVKGPLLPPVIVHL